MTHEATVARLFAPVRVSEFLSEYWQQQPLHVPARPGISDRQDYLSSEEFRELIADGRPPRGQLLLARGRLFSRDGMLGSLDSTARLAEYLDQGNPLIWNSARGATAKIDAICEALAATFEAHVWPNVYATGTAGTPLDVHFDTHEVLAIQCDGEKVWQISAVRADRPLDNPEMAATIVHALATSREVAKANPLLTVTVRPGDLLYIPRGQFHQAWTPHGRSLHVTFAIRPMSGYDVMDALRDLALEEPLFREYLPPGVADPDGVQVATYLDQLRRRLEDLAGSAELAREIRNFQKALMARGMAPQAAAADQSESESGSNDTCSSPEDEQGRASHAQQSRGGVHPYLSKSGISTCGNSSS